MRRWLVVVAVLAGVLGSACPAHADDAAPDNKAFVLGTFPRLWWGCDPVGVRIDAPPSAAHRAMVAASFARLNKLSGWSWFITDDPAAPFVVRWDSHLDGGSEVVNGGGTATMWTGYTITLSTLDSLDGPKDGQRYYSATADLEHGIGHGIGLDHTNFPGSLMGRNGGAHFGVPDMLGIRYVSQQYARRCDRPYEGIATVDHPASSAGRKP